MSREEFAREITRIEEDITTSLEIAGGESQVLALAGTWGARSRGREGEVIS